MNHQNTPRRRFFGELLALLGGSVVALGMKMPPVGAAATAPLPTAPLPAPCMQPGPDELDAWRRATRRLVLHSDDPKQRRLAAAAHAGARLRVRYLGGTEPGRVREITPGALFTVEGYPGVYLDAHCHERAAARTFAVERLALLDT